MIQRYHHMETMLLPSKSTLELTYKHLETHGNSVATDALVLKQLAISSHSVD